MLMPYIRFNGDCEEAFLWYARIFGGEIKHLAKYGDIPENPDMPMSDELKRKVMHAQIVLLNLGEMSGADSLETVSKSGNISIQAHMPKEDLARKIFSELAVGGNVLGELATNPPPDDSGISGCVEDKYGVTWIVSAVKSV